MASPNKTNSRIPHQGKELFESLSGEGFIEQIPSVN